MWMTKNILTFADKIILCENGCFSTQTNGQLGNFNDCVGFSPLLGYLLCYFDEPVLQKRDFLATSWWVNFLSFLNVFVSDFLSQTERRASKQTQAPSQICVTTSLHWSTSPEDLPSSPGRTGAPEYASCSPAAVLPLKAMLANPCCPPPCPGGAAHLDGVVLAGGGKDVLAVRVPVQAVDLREVCCEVLHRRAGFLQQDHQPQSALYRGLGTPTWAGHSLSGSAGWGGKDTPRGTACWSSG